LSNDFFQEVIKTAIMGQSFSIFLQTKECDQFI